MDSFWQFRRCRFVWLLCRQCERSVQQSHHTGAILGLLHRRHRNEDPSQGAVLLSLVILFGRGQSLQNLSRHTQISRDFQVLTCDNKFFVISDSLCGAEMRSASHLPGVSVMCRTNREVQFQDESPLKKMPVSSALFSYNHRCNAFTLPNQKLTLQKRRDCFFDIVN